METKINRKKVESYGIKFFTEKDGKEVARAYLYIMTNDLKKEPFGYLEDVFVDEQLRGQGIGTGLLETVIAEAKKLGFTKAIAPRGTVKNSFIKEVSDLRTALIDYLQK